MKSMKKLMLFFVIVVSMYLVIGCSNENVKQNTHFEASENNLDSTADDTDNDQNNINKPSLGSEEEGKKLNIQVQTNGKTIVFELNDSSAAMALYEQLPMTINVENYSDNEKIFYPDEKLDTSNTPLANAKNGTLAYYAPWGDVVMFYDNFGSASGLYELGNVVSGSEDIATLSGTIKIDKY